MKGTRFPTPASEEEHILIAARETAYSVCRLVGFRNNTRPEDVLGECWMEVVRRKALNPAVRFSNNVIQWVATDVARRLTGRRDRSLESRMNTEVENIVVRHFRVAVDERFPAPPPDPPKTPLELWSDYRPARANMMLPWAARIILYLHLVEGWTYKEISRYLVGSESGVANYLIRNLGKPPSEFLRDARGTDSDATNPDGPGRTPPQPAGVG